MAQLDVEPKKNNDWWKWLLGILAVAIIIWIVVEAMDDDVDEIDDMEEPILEDTTSLLQETESNNTIEYHRV